MRNQNITEYQKPCYMNSYSVISQHKEKMLCNEPKFLFQPIEYEKQTLTYNTYTLH